MSESLFTKCRKCGADLAKAARTCPECGSRQRKIALLWIIGGVFGALAVIGVIGSPTEDASLRAPAPGEEANPSTTLPSDEIAFIEVVERYMTVFESSKNELQQSLAREQRRQALARLLSDRAIQSWRGTIRQLETNSAGKAILSVAVSESIQIRTWNNAFSDIMSSTLIDMDTPLYAALLDVSLGQEVEVSGSFLPSGSDHLQESSMTIRGSMTKPEFIFKFATVRSL